MRVIHAKGAPAGEALPKMRERAPSRPEASPRPAPEAPPRPRAPSIPEEAPLSSSSLTGPTALYAPGLSPYQVKGSVYLGTQAYFEAMPGGLDALYGQIASPQLLAFIQQRFLTAAFYDVLPVVPLIRAEASAMGQSMRDYLRARTSYQAEKDMAGIYRVLLKLASPSAVAKRLPRLVGQIFNFGSSSVEISTEHRLVGTLTGYPAPLLAWYRAAFEVYCETALRMAGAMNVVTLVRASSTEMGPHRVELVTLRIDMTWE